MTWHDNANTRKQIGDASESLFIQQVRCHCGGAFRFIGNLRAGWPDYTCEECGQLVDVKSSPQAEKTGNLSVSEVPWRKYPADILLAALIGGRWIGEYKRNITLANTIPNAPTHTKRHSYLTNTRWHLICWRTFHSLKELGYHVDGTQILDTPN